MTTNRDLIWAATLREMQVRRGFTATDIQDAITTAEPSRRTVRNALNSMVRLGLLNSRGGSGSAPTEYFPEKPESPIEPAGYEARSSSQSIVFPYVGSKAGIADWIIDLMPAHELYVEPFAGAASVLIAKPASKYEVINDLSSDIIHFFRVLRDRGDELAEWISNVPYSREIYSKWAAEFYNGERADDDLERAGRFYSLRWMQFAGVSAYQNGFKVRARRSPSRSFANAKRRLESLAERLQEVTIEQRHYAAVLDGYDDSAVDGLFYLDPPFVNTENQYGVEVDFDELVECLHGLENDWMLSCGDIPDGLEHYPVYSKDSRHRIRRSNGDVSEYVVCNFHVDDRQQFVEQVG